jgi:holo-ACP synthase/triphosphoribosyl-dephospho-CoA synthase
MQRLWKSRKKILEEYSVPLICFGLRIPGDDRNSHWTRRLFHDGIETFTLLLEAEGIAVSHEEYEQENPQYIAGISANASPQTLVKLLRYFKETHPLGCFFNADIYEPGGRKFSQRSRGTVVRSRPVLKMMEDHIRQRLADMVSSAVVWSMMSEVAVTPKPGLVDRANSGAHVDMDFFTFIDSASAILPWFRHCAMAGFDSGDKGKRDNNPTVLFEKLKPLGRMTEVLMKKNTEGVNAQRGYIFCMGILCAAYGRLYRNTEKPDLAGVIEFSKAMTAALGEDFSRVHESGKPSHGQLIYARNGIQGIRGEVSRGFPSITEYALPLLRRMLKEGYSLNDAGVAVLLTLLANTEDTNIIHRGGVKTFRSIRKEISIFLATDPGIEAIREKAARLDREFIDKNISPGGCADLLGIAFFLYRLTQ